MSTELADLFRAEKILPVQPAFKERDNEWYRLVCPIEIKGVVVEGLQLGGSAMKRLPDESVTIQLEFHPTKGGPRGGPLARIEWRPMKGHNNKGIGPPEFQNILIQCTHNHCFEMNWQHSPAAVRRGNLPLAYPVDPDPSTFEEFIAFVAKEFRISNLSALAPPEWERALF